MEMIHNLFWYATSELSQDAFLCWLLSYARKDANDSAMILRECALAMLERMCRRDDGRRIVPAVITTIDRQDRHMDVGVRFLTEAGEEYCLIIEDKTNTAEHDDQLKRYLEAAQEAFDASHVLGVYYKSGLQGDLSAVRQANYVIMLRPDILDVLKPYYDRMKKGDAKSDILMSYYEKINDDDEKAKQFTEMPPENWDCPQIEGFFDSVTQVIAKRCGEDVGWSYVNNPSGGFMALYSFGRTIQYEDESAVCSVYLQLEFRPRRLGDIPGSARLCIKLSVESPEKGKQLMPKEKRIAIANRLLDRITGRHAGKYLLGDEPYNFERPKQLRAATAMTIGERQLYDGHGGQGWQSLQAKILAGCDDYMKFIQHLAEEGEIACTDGEKMI